MKQYLYETHSHSSDVSGCAKIPAEEVITNYINAGYNGLVLTDHLSHHSIRRSKCTEWNDIIDYFVSGYNKAVETAKKLDENFSVMFGMEIRFHCDECNDFLVYGADEDFLRSHSDILDLSVESFRKVVDENNLLIVQAHPFRFDMQIVNPKLLDGVEIYNGNANHNSNNEIARLWAEKYNLIPTSGSDYHGIWGMTSGGIYTNRQIKTGSELVEILKSRDYTIK